MYIVDLYTLNYNTKHVHSGPIHIKLRNMYIVDLYTLNYETCVFILNRIG